MNAVGCPICLSLNVVSVPNEIRCDCLDCGFWWNEYDSADE